MQRLVIFWLYFQNVFNTLHLPRELPFIMHLWRVYKVTYTGVFVIINIMLQMQFTSFELKIPQSHISVSSVGRACE